MSKVIIISSIKLDGVGSTTRALELWKNYSIESGKDVTLLITNLGKKNRNLNSQELRIIRLPISYNKRKITFFSRIFFELNAIYFCLKQPNIKYICDRHRLIGFAGFFISKFKSIPFLLEIHGLPYWEKKHTFFSKILFKIQDFIDNHQLPHANSLVINSETLKSFLNSEYGIEKSKMDVIDNAADPNFFKPIEKNICLKKLNLSTEFKYVSFIGTFAPWQGLDTLIKSMEKVILSNKKVKLLLVGDGREIGKLKKICNDLKLTDYILFTSKVPQSEVPFYIGSSEIAIAPFTGSERNKKLGFSAIKLFEYMSCSKAIITTNVCGIEKDIISNKTGKVIEPDNPDLLAKTILDLIKNPEELLKMGKNGRELVIKKHTWKSKSLLLESSFSKMDNK